MTAIGEPTAKPMCLYDILGVDRDANSRAIRSAYNELVARWSPDRTHNNSAEAEARLKDIETAFEILSNEEERFWYDANREKIVTSPSHAVGDAGDPSGVNLYRFFSPSCFNGYNHDPDGFYFVFQSAFESIADAEEISAPRFGDADFPWGRVKKFYGFWEDFSTRRKFRWVARHNLNDAANRRARGLMKKANAKAMSDCRDEWQGNVRRLVRLVRKLDPRVRDDVAEEDAEEEKGSRLDDAELDGLDLNDADSANVQLSCTICRRKFRSEKTLTTHQSSAKHLRRVKQVVALLQNEPEEIGNVMNGVIVVGDEDDSSVAGRSVVSGFSEDFVMVEELVSEEDDDGVEIDAWDGTIALDEYSDGELEIIDVDMLDGVARASRATEEDTGMEAAIPPSVDMDLMLAQQLASGLNILGDNGDVNDAMLAQLDDPTNLDRMLALQLEQEDLMARQAISRVPPNAETIDSSDDAYDSELDTLVDALNAKMISLDDPNVNVKDLERRLQRAIARSGNGQRRKSKRGRKRRRKKNRQNVGGDGANSSDEAEERVDEFLGSFRQEKGPMKTKKELRGDKKRRRRRRVANDPNSTARCAGCHRGFASKTKLARHLHANPAHVHA